MRDLLSEHATMLARRCRRRRKGDPVQNVAVDSLGVLCGRWFCSYAYNRRHSSLGGEGLLSRSVNLSAGRRRWAQGGPHAGHRTEGSVGVQVWYSILLYVY